MNKLPWRRVLYAEQDYPDNFVPTEFWRDMKKLKPYVKTSPFEAFYGATALTFQICSVSVFAGIFVYLRAEMLHPNLALLFTCLTTLLGYICYRYFHGSHRSVTNELRSVCVFMFFGFWVSPILMTLTDTISTDTVYAMSCFMFFLHLVFHNYGADAAIVSEALSLNAALFGCICLASRLRTPYYSFTLLVTAVSMFALLPVFYRRLRERGNYVLSCIFVCLHGVATVVVVFSLSFELAIFLVVLLFLVNFVCPIWFLRLQKYKENIYGLWDEAEISDGKDNT